VERVVGEVDTEHEHVNVDLRSVVIKRGMVLVVALVLTLVRLAQGIPPRY
jgi:hypothetical protein